MIAQVTVVNGFVSGAADAQVFRRCKSEGSMSVKPAEVLYELSECGWTRTDSESGSTRHTLSFGSEASFNMAEETTITDPRCTVLIRNISEKDTPRILRNLLNNLGFHATYDLLHMPLSRTTRKPRGYAFVRFLDEEYAAEALEALEGLVTSTTDKKGSKGLSCKVAENANLDIEYLMQVSSFENGVEFPPEFLPMLFNQENGSELMFPSAENSAFLSVVQLKDL